MDARCDGRSHHAAHPVSVLCYYLSNSQLHDYCVLSCRQQLCVLLEAFTNRVLDATAALQVMQQYCDRHPGSVLLYSVQLPSLPACEVSCTCAGLSIPSLNDVRPCRAVGCLMPHRLLFCAASALTAILSAGAQDAICSPSFIGRVKFKQVLLMTKRHKSPPPPTPSVKNMAGPEPESAQPGTQASQQPESSGMSFLDELMFLSQTQDSALLEGLPEQATVPVVGDKDPTVEPAHKETTGSDDDNADADIAIDDDGQGLPPRSRAAMKDVDRGEAVLTSDLLADVLQEWPDD